jgi:hypothetical protein
MLQTTGLVCIVLVDIIASVICKYSHSISCLISGIGYQKRSALSAKWVPCGPSNAFVNQAASQNIEESLTVLAKRKKYLIILVL